MFADKPVEDWSQTLEDLDVPHSYFLTFAAFIASVSAILLPWAVVGTVIPMLAKSLIPADASAFLIDDYMPELREATKDVKLSHQDKQGLINKATGMFMKLIYAFLWQEHFIPMPAVYKHPSALRLASWFLPHWNAFSTKISGFAQTDDAVVTATNVYPGDSFCQGYSPHAIWHEESANGLLELVFMADAVNHVLEKYF